MMVIGLPTLAGSTIATWYAVMTPAASIAAMRRLTAEAERCTASPMSRCGMRLSFCSSVEDLAIESVEFHAASSIGRPQNCGSAVQYRNSVARAPEIASELRRRRDTVSRPANEVAREKMFHADDDQRSRPPRRI